ncbi:C2 domain protein, partial [Toxoplasma gondii TgCatPRC2]
ELLPGASRPEMLGGFADKGSARLSHLGFESAMKMPNRGTRSPSGLESNRPEDGNRNMEEIFLQHQATILASDQLEELPASLRPPLSKRRKGEDKKDGNKADGPQVKMTISLMHASSMNKGLGLVSSERPADGIPRWDNLGEIYFRGTLRDLDSTYIQVVVEDTTAPKVMRQIGYGQIPLRGVVDYSCLSTELGTPMWLALQAKMEGWGHELKEWCFGFVEGTVMVAHLPRYRQLGEVSESDSDRVYLILRIKDVDQIVTPDNRPVVDSYVEVSFDGTSRRTRTVRNTLNPVWDDEVTIPLRLPAFRDITESDVTRKGKVWLDVWGTGPGYVDHLGGCSFSLYEIFFNEKHNKRNLTAMQRIDLEANTRQSYETRVFSTSRRLAFIHKADRPSTIQFEAWTCPDILEVSGIDKLPEPERITTTSNFPRALRNTYERLKRMYAEVIEKKGLVNPDTGVGPPRFFDVEFLDQRKETHYAPTMVTRIRPPFGVDSESSVFHYCRCVPFAVKRENLVFTPEFAVQIRSGNAMDHSILMTSLLLGLPAFAFVCV